MWSFAWPIVFLVLPLPIIIYYLIPRSKNLNEVGLLVPNIENFSTLKNRNNKDYFYNRRTWLSAIAWILLVIAAARPEHIGDELDISVAGRNLMIAVDLSVSMKQEDFELAGRRVDRLTATKAVASDFIDRRKGDRIGLILFGQQAYLQVPLTLDLDTVNIFLMEAFIGLAGESTAIGDAITLAVRRIHEQNEKEIDQILILLTDGRNTAGEIQPLKAAELAQQIGLKIYTIGIGAEQLRLQSTFGAPRLINPSNDLDANTLTKIADLTGGQYFRATDTKSLQDIYKLVDELEPIEELESGFRPIKSYFHYPLGLSFLLSLFLGIDALVKRFLFIKNSEEYEVAK